MGNKKCSYCGGTHTQKRGRVKETGKQIYICVDCNRCFCNTPHLETHRCPNCDRFVFSRRGTVCGECATEKRKVKLVEKKKQLMNNMGLSVICPQCRGVNTYIRSQHKDSSYCACIDCGKNFPIHDIASYNDPMYLKCRKCHKIKPIGSFTSSTSGKISTTCAECKQSIKYLKLYGIGMGQFTGMLDEQNHKCKICGTHISRDEKQGVCIDHDHNTGIVRGLLCLSCNMLLGFARDDIAILSKAKKYLQSFM